MHRYHHFTWSSVSNLCLTFSLFFRFRSVTKILQLRKANAAMGINPDEKNLSVANTSFLCVCRISSFKWTLCGIHVHQEVYYQCFNLLQDWRRESDNKLYNSHSFSFFEKYIFLEKFGWKMYGRTSSYATFWDKSARRTSSYASIISMYYWFLAYV